MNAKLASLLAGGAMLAITGVASAADQLSEKEMDGVTAGITSLAQATSVTFGDIISNTFSQTSTFADDFARVPAGAPGASPAVPFAFAAASTTGASVSAIFQAVSSSFASSQVQR